MVKPVNLLLKIEIRIGIELFFNAFKNPTDFVCFLLKKIYRELFISDMNANNGSFV